MDVRVDEAGMTVRPAEIDHACPRVGLREQVADAPVATIRSGGSPRLDDRRPPVQGQDLPFWNSVSTGCAAAGQRAEQRHRERGARQPDPPPAHRDASVAPAFSAYWAASLTCWNHSVPWPSFAVSDIARWANRPVGRGAVPVQGVGGMIRCRRD